MIERVKIVVTVPETHTDVVRRAAGEAGAGKLGKYSFCSFSTKGIGRYLPEQGAHPHIGTVGHLESVFEDKIEFTCDKSLLDDVIVAIKNVHPYEEIALDVYPLL